MIVSVTSFATARRSCSVATRDSSAALRTLSGLTRNLMLLAYGFRVGAVALHFDILVSASK